MRSMPEMTLPWRSELRDRREEISHHTAKAGQVVLLIGWNTAWIKTIPQVGDTQLRANAAGLARRCYRDYETQEAW